MTWSGRIRPSSRETAGRPPGRGAVWDRDPALCDGDTLRDLNPTHTFVGGLLVTLAGER
ncbi:hypothetical protein [Streptomyces sp. NPDC008240]|uniref:hypothetical protein n=1 Tax=Streptomyces sp. NPDC008240 TaxID=3364822 RepID=UPI0036E9FE1B